jgi:drug/metabolite transporter (DMT)-like permease
MTRGQNLLLLHFIVIIFGFTGILGKEISIESIPLVFYRMLIGFAGLALYMGLFNRKFDLSRQAMLGPTIMGLVIAVHWITFFEAIKQSNVSVTLATMASTALFVSLLNPIIQKTKLVLYEVVLGLCTIVGIVLIFGFASNYFWGITLALISSCLAALFTIYNARLVRTISAVQISTVEMGSGAIIVLIFLLIQGDYPSVSEVPNMDWVWLLVLGLVATAFAFVASVEVMKVLSPFTVALTVNLEPVYTILMALFIYKEEELMNVGFYIGAAIIVATIFVNSYIKESRKGSPPPDILDA